MIKQGGQWQAVDWTAALGYVADGLKRIQAEFGAHGIGALATPHSTVEELHLLAKLVRGLGSENIDSAPGMPTSATSLPAGSARWLGTSIASLSTLQSAFVVGSFLRKDHPLFAQRLRQAARKGARIHRLHALDDDWLMPIGTSMIAGPSAWLQALAGVAAAVAVEKGVAAPLPGTPDAAATAIARSLLEARAQGAAARQCRCAAPACRRVAGHGAVDRRTNRRHDRLPGRSRQQRRRAAGWRVARCRRSERRADAVASRWRRCCC